MRSRLRLADDVDGRLLVGFVEAYGVGPGPASQELSAGIDALVARRAEQQDFPPPELRDGLRALLRSAGYKPSGRGKPASEYLAGAARSGAFPRISAVVDTANRYSLLTGLPISLLDLDRALAETEGLVIRPGRAGESYAFNASGQEIDVAGLLCVCREDGGPLGNAVKDSLATRTDDATEDVVGVLWCSSAVAPADVVERMARQLGEQLVRYAGAKAFEAGVLSAAG